MKHASAAFALLLVAAHAAGDLDELLGQPLSVFREEPHAWLGYALFAALLAVGSLYTAALIRAGEENEAVTGALATLLLFVVAVTPSLQVLHVFCSLALLLLLFAHYGRLLRESQSPWLVLHVVVPFAVAMASGFHSYGLWQKSMILYFVALATVRHHLLGRRAAVARVGTGTRGRRRVYRLEPGRAWSRRKGE